MPVLRTPGLCADASFSNTWICEEDIVDVVKASSETEASLAEGV